MDEKQVLDLTQCRATDTQAIGFLLRFHDEKEGICHLSPEIKQEFSVAKVDSLFT